MNSAKVLRRSNQFCRTYLGSCFFRSIIVNFSFIDISCIRSSMRHAVLIWLYGKIFEKVTTLCFVLSLYDKNRFIFTIYFYIICFVLYSWNLCLLQLLEKIVFFSIRDQIINIHAAFWGRFLRCGRVTMNE